MSYIAVGRDAPAAQTPEQIAKRQRDAAAMRAYQATQAGIADKARRDAQDVARRQAFLVSTEGQRRVAEADAKRQAKQEVVDDAILTNDKVPDPSGGSSTTKYLLIGGVALAAGWFFFLRKK